MTATANTARPRGLAAFTRLAILHDSARRGGLRVVRVAERERYEELAASYVMETRNPAACHFTPWARLATPRTICAKVRAVLATRAATLSAPTAAQRPSKMPVNTTAAGAVALFSA